MNLFGITGWKNAGKTEDKNSQFLLDQWIVWQKNRDEENGTPFI